MSRRSPPMPRTSSVSCLSRAPSMLRQLESEHWAQLILRHLFSLEDHEQERSLAAALHAAKRLLRNWQKLQSKTSLASKHSAKSAKRSSGRRRPKRIKLCRNDKAKSSTD